MMGVVEVMALRPREQQLKRAGGKPVAAVGVDCFDHANKQPGIENEGVDAEANACYLLNVKSKRAVCVGCVTVDGSTV